MTSTLALHPSQHTFPTSRALQDILASTYALYLMTHNYHWNVEGNNFINLHKLFESQYLELFEAVDVIAERIRALGEYALPFENKDILDISKLMSNALNKETKANERAERMLRNLISLNEAVIAHCQLAKDISRADHDDETENLIVERVTVHQKSLWMLRSSL